MLEKNDRIENPRFGSGVPAPKTMGRISQAAYQRLSLEYRFFNESLCDDYPWSLRWREAEYKNPDWHLDQRNPKYPEVVPGPFLDYYLNEIIPLPPERNSYGENNKALPLDEAELDQYLPLFRRLFPHFTRKEMEAVRWCEYEWYDGSNPLYLYSDWD